MSDDACNKVKIVMLLQAKTNGLVELNQIYVKAIANEVRHCKGLTYISIADICGTEIAFSFKSSLQASVSANQLMLKKKG